MSIYNPWWVAGAEAFDGLPGFRRDLYEAFCLDVARLPQIISVTGPRRVGKSTLLKQCIQKLIQDNGAAQAGRLLYFTFDEPALYIPGFDADRFFNDLVSEFAVLAKDGPVFLFLDEIQKFPRWELYLKKYHDLNTPVRFVISGSASAPIFRKSLESLLGRIKTYRMLPFSFRESLCLQVGKMEAGRIAGIIGNELRRKSAPKQLVGWMDFFLRHSEDGLITDIDGGNTSFTLPYGMLAEFLQRYFYEGGFPEVWTMPDLLAKQAYLYQNQVERVIFEDLLIAAEFRKPELMRRFYLGLLQHPGMETNLSRLSMEIGIGKASIDNYFPLLEATDLVWRLQKYSGARNSAKSGNFKTYLVDLAVRNAVLKITPQTLANDESQLGAYAENMIANHLRLWPGLVELAYFRERNNELDFIVDLGHTRVGIEVKYRNQPALKDAERSALLAKELGCEAFILVGKSAQEEKWKTRLASVSGLPVAVIPLVYFAWLF
ncbi:MAG: ATP-binding protein [Pseudomonadota bacterium]